MSSSNDLFLPLEVNFMDNAKIMKAGEKAGWLFLAMSLLSKRLLSDGFVSDQQVKKFGLAGTPQRLAKLQEGEEPLIVRTDGGWVLPAYLKRNKSSAEVRETQRLEREAGVIGNHRKYHKDGRTSPRCDVCTGRLVDPNPPPDNSSARVPDRGPGSTETETEPKTDPQTETEPGTSNGRPASPARQRVQNERVPDLVFEVICEVCGYDRQQLTRDERGRVNTVAKQLKDVDPDEIRRHAANWHLHFPDATLVPQSLTKNWTLTDNPPKIPAPRVVTPPVGDRNTDRIDRVIDEMDGSVQRASELEATPPSSDVLEAKAS